MSVEEVNVGRYRSRAKFWRIEPHFGTKVAAALEDAERLSVEAASARKLLPTERPGIVDIESQGQKLVMVMQSVVRMATGNA